MADENFKKLYDDNLVSGAAIRDSSGRVINDRFGEAFSYIGDLDSLLTVDHDNLVYAINDTVASIGSLGDLKTSDKESLVSAVNENVSHIGDMGNLSVAFPGSDKDLVSAISGNHIYVTEQVMASNERYEHDHHLITDSDGYICQVFPATDVQDFSATDNRIVNYAQGEEMNRQLSGVREALVLILGTKSSERKTLDELTKDGTLSAVSALNALHARTDSLGNFIDVTKYAACSSHSYDSSTGRDTETFYNVYGQKIGETVTDYPFESHLRAMRFDEQSATIIYADDSGKEFKVPLSKLVDTYKGSQGTVDIAVNGYTISAAIRDGMVKQSMLDPSISSDLESYAKAEASRASAEDGRARAESAREASESNRASNEQLRQSAEADRASNENERKSNENSRKKAEEDRISSEQAREKGESERKANEESRESEELKRATAESSRVSVETSRSSAESSRVSAEEERVKAEAQRKANEEIRVANENARLARPHLEYGDDGYLYVNYGE